MQIVVSKVDLSRTLTRCQGVSDRKSTMPILANVLLEAKDDEVRISATDLNLAIAGAVPAEVKQPGSIAIGARELLERVKLMPDGDISITANSESVVTIRAAGSPRRYTVHGLPADKFPSLPKPEPSAPSLELDIQAIRQLILGTHFSISTDDSRMHLNSALLEWNGDRIRMVTTDGHRLSMMEVEVPQQFADAAMLIPLKGVIELRRLCDEYPDRGPDLPTLVMTQSGSSVFFQLPGFQLSVKLVDAQFPPYQQVIPEKTEQVIRIPRVLMADALRAVSIASSEKTGGVRLTVEADMVRFESESAQSGAGFDEVAVEYDGKPVTMGLNAKYLLDVLGALDCEEVALGISGELDPTIVRPATTDKRQSYVAVIMPMRI